MAVTLEQASVNLQQKATQPSPRPKVSIIILNWNTRELTLQCLSSLKQTLGDFPAQLIAVDNDSTDGSADAIAKDHPDVCLVRSPENVGFARGNNLALPEAQGQYIFLLNSDTIVLPGAVQHLVNYLDEHPEIAAAGGEHLTAEDEVVPHGMFFPSLWSDLSMALGLRKFGRLLLKRRSRLALLWYPLDTREVDWLSNSFVAIRREAIDRVGPLPEEFFLYGEDVEWYWRFREAGLRVAYVAGAPIVHLANRSSDQLYKGNEKSYRYLDGFYTFAARHRNPISWRLGWLANSLYWTALATRSCGHYLITGRADAAEKARMLWAYARYHVDQVTGRVPPIAR
jgi:GT2 family glycosyltransferase